MSEQQLRKALGAVNDLEPPADHLFAQRALGRGRARAHRRRSAVLGAAAGIVVVGAVGGTWLTGAWPQQSSVDASAGAPERAVAPQSDQGSAVAEPGPSTASALNGEVLHAAVWFTGPSTPASTAMEALAPSLAAQFPEVFAGAYAADAGNTSIVVAVTRADATLARLVTSGLPAGTPVAYRTVPNSIGRLEAALDRVAAERDGWQAKGVPVLAARIDPRANRVLVTVPGGDAGLVTAALGPDVVTVLTEPPPDTMTGTATLPVLPAPTPAPTPSR